MARKLSHIPAVDLSTVIPGQAAGLRAYDALAYDKVSSRPSLGRRTESLERDRYETDSHAKARSDNPYNALTIRMVHFHGLTHPKRNKREYLEANSLDNILLPTAANDLCPKCGLTVSCTHVERPVYQESSPWWLTLARVQSDWVRPLQELNPDWSTC